VSNNKISKNFKKTDERKLSDPFSSHISDMPTIPDDYDPFDDDEADFTDWSSPTEKYYEYLRSLGPEDFPDDPEFLARSERRESSLLWRPWLYIRAKYHYFVETEFWDGYRSAYYFRRNRFRIFRRKAVRWLKR
jgi:hypothetical protein